MIQTRMSHLRYKDFLIWVHEKAVAAEVPALKTWCKCFPSYERMDATLERLAFVQQLEAKIHDPSAGQDPAAERFVSVFWPFEDFLEYFSSQPDLMDPVGMEFHEPDYRYVLIVRGDEFPCGARPWCQLTVSFANHGERARSINYTWTLDLSLCSEHNVEALRDFMAHNLECIQHVLDNGYIVLCGYRVDCGCIVGGDSPWLRHVFGLSVWWGVGSLYTYVMWNAASNQWEHTTTVRSWKGHRKFLKVFHRSRPKATVSDVYGCMRLPLLKVHDRYFSIVMCILHCLISVGKQTTIYVRRYAKKVAPAVRAEVQRILTEANTKISVQGKASPKGEETWRPLILWPAMAHLLHVPRRAQKAVIAMGKLCAALYSTYHKPSTLKCAKVARRFQEEICPRLRSPYLLWLRRDARRVLDAIRPWGCAMFSGDVVESLNAFLQDIFLTATSRGGGKGTPEEQLIELLFQAMSRGFLYKEMPRWREVEGLGALQIQHCADVAREYLGEMLESRWCIPIGPRWGAIVCYLAYYFGRFESV